METVWDYSDRAHTYDQRADYSLEAVASVLANTGSHKGQHVADIGAGTGKLTKLLLDHGLRVLAVEPNDNMRSYGISNTKGRSVTWSDGVGESTGLADSCVQAAFFGSSFNVVDPQAALLEVSRILIPGGWFACMWNHRDIADDLQSSIEQIIHNAIPNFSYGTRREDPAPLIDSSGLFGPVHKIESRFTVSMTSTQILDAWRSHDTLFRQSAGKFDLILSNIESVLTSNQYDVPYFTRIWYAQLSNI